ncbi:MAG: PhnD/SsuA/transferrin family substrate-binding protein [Candidatus Thiodiazotropha sp.]
MSTISANSSDLPDRYQGEIPNIGYFGRMEKILISANVTDTTIATNMIIKKIFGLMDMEADINLYKDVEALKTDVSENHIDAVFVNIFDYFAMENLLSPDYIYALSLRPDKFEKTLLLTRKEYGITSLNQLKGLSISIPSGHLLGRYYLDLELMKRNLPKTEKYFSHINETDDINSAIIDLFFGKSDCALVTDIALDNAGQLNEQVSKKLDILLTSGEMVPQVIALNKNISTSILKDVEHHIVKAHEVPQIKKLLTLFRAEKIVKLYKDQLQESRRLLIEYSSLNEVQAYNR